MVWRGTYAGGTAYVPDDVVEYTDTSITSSYICTANTTGNAPSSGGTAHASWAYMAKGAAGTPTTTQGDIIYRGASADQRLAKGTAAQVLKMNSGATAPEWGSGFAGSHYLAYDNNHQHGSTVTVNGSGLNNGYSDGDRDCIVINNGNYHTVTPHHADDIFVMHVMTTIYANWSSGSYWGIGFQSATASDFSAGRAIIFLSGQHSMGNGNAGGDEYRITSATQQFNCGDIGFSAGTTYYIRGIGQIHSTNQNVSFNNANGVRERSEYVSWLRHYKKNL